MESEGSGELRLGVGLKGGLDEVKRLLIVWRIEERRKFRANKEWNGDGRKGAILLYSLAV